VGKRAGESHSQDAINKLIVEKAYALGHVVRLKGGDPVVFGRGGEEAQALMEARIPFTVVPGITSAIGVPAAAGIPVTHRNVSPAFTVVTGHRESGGSTNIEWESLAKVGGTIVVLMGVAERAVIASRLMAGGLSPETPVAAVRWGTRAEQETTRTTLGELGTAALKAPSTIVIGAVAAYEFIAGVHIDSAVAGS
jgi:uroporphyrin-III C-methyltransferase